MHFIIKLHAYAHVLTSKLIQISHEFYIHIQNRLESAYCGTKLYLVYN